MRRRSESTQQLVAEAEALVNKRAPRAKAQPLDDTKQLIQDAEALVARNRSGAGGPVMAACVVLGGLAAAGVYLWLR